MAYNNLIVEDVLNCHEAGRHCLVLTERTAHVDLITKMLSARCANVIVLKGGMSNKETIGLMNKIATTPVDQTLIIVATGKFIGEGFDESRLDTLFLAMPISWKGTLQQYVGRLHRLHVGKQEVQVYDYVDIRVKMLERMYSKRLQGYAAVGYKPKGLAIENEVTNIIYDRHSFFSIYSQDINLAKKTILIVSPFITQKKVLELLRILQEPFNRKVEVTIITRPMDDFNSKFNRNFENNMEIMQSAGVVVLFKKRIHQKFAVIDRKIVWYGSINLLSFGYSEESIMRIVSGNIALELLDSLP